MGPLVGPLVGPLLARGRGLPGLRWGLESWGRSIRLRCKSNLALTLTLMASAGRLYSDSTGHANSHIRVRGRVTVRFRVRFRISVRVRGRVGCLLCRDPMPAAPRAIDNARTGSELPFG